jgi:hypothetical protein
VRQVKAQCLRGGAIRPAGRVHCSTCRHNRFFAHAVGPGVVDPAKARLHCHSSRSFLVFRIQ